MHNIYYSVIDDTEKAKKECEADWNECAEREGGSSGLHYPIRWEKTICKDYDEAMEYIEQHDNGWYDQLAVRFYEYPEIKGSKAYDNLKERLKKANEKYIALKEKIHYKGVKSKFVSCKTCESKLNSEYFGTSLKNVCPICHNDLRPLTTLETLENYKNNVEKLKKEIKAEEDKLNLKMKNKATVKWLVKVEYHT